MAPLNPHAPLFVPAAESPPASPAAPSWLPVSYSLTFPCSYYSLPRPLLEAFPLPACCYYQSQFSPWASFCHYTRNDLHLPHGFPSAGAEFLGFPWPSSAISPLVLPALPAYQLPVPLLHSPSACGEMGLLLPPIYPGKPSVIHEVIPKASHGYDNVSPPPRAIVLRKRRVKIGPRWRMKPDSLSGKPRRPARRSINVRVGSYWLPKLRCLRKKCPEDERLIANLQFKKGTEEDVKGDSRTTVMIKNLPNKLRKEDLLSLLDLHCRDENSKTGCVAPVHPAARSQFDFFYLPMDFATGSNLGYAFVNFTSSSGAWKLHRAFHQMKWTFMSSKKICEVTYARIQGLPALLKHFRSSVFVCDDDELLPLFFVPHRDGVMQCEDHHVGRRVSKSGPEGP